MRPLLLALTLLLPAAQADEVATVTATVETPALFDDAQGGNANGDDPAIWVHPTRRAKSLVIATAKEGGLYVYGLGGEQRQHVPAPPPPGPDDEPGRFNNVDLVYGFRLSSGATVDLAVVSDRGHDQVRFYAIDPASGSVRDVTDPAVPYVFNATQQEVNEASTVYGLATWQDATGTFALVSRRHATRLGLLKLTATAGGKVGYSPVRTLDLPSAFPLPDGSSWTPCAEPGELPQVEGMVVDGGRDVLYAAQEDVGVWRLRADLTAAPVLMDKVKEYGRHGTFDPDTEECTLGPDQGFGGTHLAADAEGLTIYYGRGGDGYLLASSQGDDTFAVYERQGRNRYLAQFRVGEGRVDGAQTSDGAMVTQVGLGPAFPHGLLVVHDGVNTPADGERENTDFKFVRWEEVAQRLSLG